MTMSKELQAAFNDQIALEFESAYVYLGMAAWFEAQDLVGFARWFRAQAAEESAHGMKFFEHVIDRDARVVLQAIPAPSGEFESAVHAVERALAHEQHVTEAIGRLYGQASDEHDFSSLPLLNWFMSEQIEEEATVRQILAELRMVGDDSAALLLLDREMANRHGEGADASA